jgi:hypothetical protein
MYPLCNCRFLLRQAGFVALLGMFCFFGISAVVVEMDDGLDLVVVINQADMAADRDVAVLAWRRRQEAHQIGRCGVHLPAQVLVQQVKNQFTWKIEKY